MTNSKSPYLKGAVWLGLVFLLPSAAGMFAIVTADAESFEPAPRWLVFSGALVFFNAGITVGLMDSGFNDYRKTWWLSYLHSMALVSILLIFLMLLNWVAFGPGEREFSMSISIPFININYERANEIFGRIFFGIPALVMDAAFVYAMYGLIVETFKKKKEGVEQENPE